MLPALLGANGKGSSYGGGSEDRLKGGGGSGRGMPQRLQAARHLAHLAVAAQRIKAHIRKAIGALLLHPGLRAAGVQQVHGAER